VITYREARSVDLQAICVTGLEINVLHHAAWPDVFAPSGDPQRVESVWREMIDSSRIAHREPDDLIENRPHRTMTCTSIFESAKSAL